MALRMTEEEYAEWQRRQGRKVTTCCAPAAPSGVSVDDLYDLNENAAKRQKYGNKRVEVDGIVYVADFVAVRPDMSIEAVYDAKSPATKQNRVYINKKKQMKACWGIEIKEV